MHHNGILVALQQYLFQRIVYCSHITHFTEWGIGGGPKWWGPLAVAQSAPPLIRHWSGAYTTIHPLFSAAVLRIFACMTGKVL